METVFVVARRESAMGCAETDQFESIYILRSRGRGRHSLLPPRPHLHRVELRCRLRVVPLDPARGVEKAIPHANQSRHAREALEMAGERRGEGSLEVGLPARHSPAEASARAAVPG